MTLKDIKEITAKTKATLEVHVDHTVPEHLAETIVTLTALLPALAETVTITKRLWREKQQQILADNMKESPMKLKQLMDIGAADEEQWLTYSEQLTASVKQSMRGLITVLSFRKEELNVLKYGGA